MFDCADTTRLSPDERLREASAILASGVLRLRQSAAVPAEKTAENPAELPTRRRRFETLSTAIPGTTW
jgi:hypothetical protein